MGLEYRKKMFMQFFGVFFYIVLSMKLDLLWSTNLGGGGGSYQLNMFSIVLDVIETILSDIKYLFLLFPRLKNHLLSSILTIISQI